MPVYEEYLNYRLTGRCSNPFWQRKFGGMSGGDVPGGGDEPGSGDTPGGDEPAELLSWEGVAYHIKQGDYKDVYKIGDEIPLDLGSEGLIHMQVAAFDADDLADSSGNAPMTFIAKELLKTQKRMNPAQAGSSGAYTEGTGTIGGWEKCEMRSYLQNTIKSLIPMDVASMIVSVSKTQRAADTALVAFTQTTADDVWIPNSSEAAIYGNGDADRIKCIVGSTSASAWWTRHLGGTSYWQYVNKSGSVAGNANQTAYAKGICLGFCVGKTPT